MFTRHEPTLRMKHTAVVTLIASFTCVSATPVLAQDGPAEKATRLYEAAMEAHSEGRYREASELLAKAYAYDNNLVYQYNRIMFLQLNGDYAEALSIMEIYEDPMLEDPRGRFSNVSMLRVKLAEQAEEKARMEAMVKADEEAKAAAAAAANAEKEPDVSDPGDAAEPEDPKEDAPLEPAVGSAPVLGYALVGLGGASAIAGGLLIGGVFYPEMDDRGTGSEEYMKQQTIEGQKTASYYLLGGGAVAIGAGIALILLHDDGVEDGAEDSASLHLVPALTPGALGAQVLGRF